VDHTETDSDDKLAVFDKQGAEFNPDLVSRFEHTQVVPGRGLTVKHPSHQVDALKEFYEENDGGGMANLKLR
jgi:hypothetical protein